MYNLKIIAVDECGRDTYLIVIVLINSKPKARADTIPDLLAYR